MAKASCLTIFSTSVCATYCYVLEMFGGGVFKNKKICVLCLGGTADASSCNCHLLQPKKTIKVWLHVVSDCPWKLPFILGFSLSSSHHHQKSGDASFSLRQLAMQHLQRRCSPQSPALNLKISGRYLSIWYLVNVEK